MAFTWVPGSLFRELVPWLGLLLLFIPQRNRPGAAWLVWLPLFCGLGLGVLLPVLLESFPGQPANVLADVVRALAFGLAAVWLLSPCLARRHRFLTFLCMFSGVVVASGLAFALNQEWGDSGVEAVFSAIPIGLSSLILSAALSFTGLFCRKRYGLGLVIAWSFAWIVAGSVAVTAPFFVLAEVMTSGSVMVWEFIGGVGVLAGINFLVLLPFLALSGLSAFYRERLKGLLHLDRGTAPPVIAPPPAVEAFSSN